MAKPRVIIADTDANYIIPLQLKFAEDYFEKVDLEIITDEMYFDELFSTPQSADILIISELLYDSSIQRHNIPNVFLMTEQYEEEMTADLSVDRIFKYTSIKEIFNEVIGKSAVFRNIEGNSKQETQIVLVYSAGGGVGKTTVAIGISAALTKNYKRVMYINAAQMQCFQYLLKNDTAITAPDIYAKLASIKGSIYPEIKHVLRKELFTYLPPFKAALMSVGVDYSVYRMIAESAKKSGDFDFVVVDADSCFDEEKAKLMELADRVVIVTDQTYKSVFATNMLVSNINGSSADKYIFVCNNFDKAKDNALISPSITAKFSVSDYVDHFDHYDKMSVEELAGENSVQKTAFLII